MRKNIEQPRFMHFPLLLNYLKSLDTKVRHIYIYISFFNNPTLFQNIYIHTSTQVDLQNFLFFFCGFQ